MIIAQVAKIATGVLAFCSVRNVVETVSLVNTVTKEGGSIASTRLPDNSGGILQQYINPTSSEIQIAKSKSTNDIVNDLSKMKRKELLTLFLLCEAPKQRADLEGSWEGILLDNNYVLTSVSGFITNSLFGFGSGQWRGKKFGIIHNNRDVGINLFGSKSEDESETNHLFNYSVEKSKFGGEDSMVLEYKEYQSVLSPWYTMTDECRVLRISSNGGYDERSILICMGSMAWSADLNCQPFCLVKNTSD